MSRPAQSAFIASLLIILLCSAASFLRNAVYKTSVLLWERTVADSAGKRRPRFNYGQTLAIAGRDAEALNVFRSIWSLPDDGSVAYHEVYREMGTAYSHLGLVEDAILLWKRALETVPADPRVLTNLAAAMKRKGELDTAMLYAERALGSGFELPETLAVLGDIALEQGDYRRAAVYLKRYLVLKPEDARGAWSMALALRETGDLSEALEYARRFREQERDLHYQGIADRLVAQIQDMLAQKMP